MLTPAQIAMLFGVFFVVSTVFMMFGQGGGAVYVPMLLAFGIPLYHAAATSQVLIMAATLSALLVFQKARLVDWWLALVVEPPTNAGAFLGGFLSGYIPGGAAKLVFACILVIGAFFMIRPPREREGAGGTGPRRWYRFQRRLGETAYHMNLLVLVPVMMIAGFVAGLLGVGGGLIKVPAMVLLGGVPMKIAVGSSSLMVGITALTGLAGHALAGHFDPRLALALGLAVFGGAQAGARLGVRIDKKKHKKYFGLLLLGIATWMAYMAVTSFQAG